MKYLIYDLNIILLRIGDVSFPLSMEALGCTVGLMKTLDTIVVISMV